MDIDISTGSGRGQQPIPLNFMADQDRMVGLPTVHSECPPISTYSELSAQMSYYSSLNSTQRTKTSTPSITSLVTTEASSPLNPASASSDWQASESSKGTSMMLRTCTPSPLPKASISFEARSPLQVKVKKAGSEQKKHNLACFFCRERKIVCRRPPEGSDNPSCK